MKFFRFFERKKKIQNRKQEKYMKRWGKKRDEFFVNIILTDFNGKTLIAVVMWQKMFYRITWNETKIMRDAVVDILRWS